MGIFFLVGICMRTVFLGFVEMIKQIGYNTLEDVPNAILGENDGFSNFLLFQLHTRTIPFERKVVIRGEAGCGEHVDVFDKYEVELSRSPFYFKVISGGALLVFHSEKTIIVYNNGSCNYGEADRNLACKLIQSQEEYHDYDVGL